MARAVVCVLLMTAVVAADEETARYFLERATRALDANRLDEAEKMLKRSLSEHKDYAPTLFGLAELARRRGKPKLAIPHLDACLAQKGRKGLTADERTAIKAAEDMLTVLAAARVEFQRMVDEFVAKLMALAKKSKNPEIAAECRRMVLLVRPDHKGAKIKPSSAPKSNGEALFNTKDLEQWTGGDPVWTVADGVMRGELADAANVSRFRREIGGDFVLTCELRVIKNLGRNPLHGIVFGLRGSYDHFGLWMWQDRWALERQTEEYKRSELQRRSFKRYRGKFLASKWHVYRIVRKGKRVTCFVDDQELWSFAGTDRTLDGFVGIWVQERNIEVRRFELKQ